MDNSKILIGFASFIPVILGTLLYGIALWRSDLDDDPLAKRIYRKAMMYSTLIIVLSLLFTVVFVFLSLFDLFKLLLLVVFLITIVTSVILSIYWLILLQEVHGEKLPYCDVNYDILRMQMLYVFNKLLLTENNDNSQNSKYLIEDLYNQSNQHVCPINYIEKIPENMLGDISKQIREVAIEKFKEYLQPTKVQFAKAIIEGNLRTKLTIYSDKHSDTPLPLNRLYEWAKGIEGLYISYDKNKKASLVTQLVNKFN